MNRKEIKKWMIDSGITQAQIAKEAGVSEALVSMVLKGERTVRPGAKESKARIILVLLRGHGCPEEFLQRAA